MIYIIGILIFVALVVGFFVGSAILLWLTKLFKVSNFTFKDSMKFILIYTILSFVVAIVFTVINLGIISSILMTVASFFIFNFLIKKYQVDWKKALGLFVSLVVINGAISLFIILPVRSLVMQPFYIKGGAMEPSFNDRDYLFINMMNKNYNRSDVVVFKYPKDPKNYFIKRIIGLPGDQIEIKDSKVYLNGNQLDEPYLASGTETNLPLRGYGTLTLKEGEYFLLGDNRDKSLDSRIFGPVTDSLMVGKIWFQMLPRYKEFK